MGSLDLGERKLALDFPSIEPPKIPGLSRLEAFQTIARTKVAELGQQIALGLAGLRSFGWQQAIGIFKQLTRMGLDEIETREKDRNE